MRILNFGVELSDLFFDFKDVVFISFKVLGLNRIGFIVDICKDGRWFVIDRELYGC